MSGYIIMLCCAISLLFGAGGTYYVKNEADKLHLEEAVKAQQTADTTSCNADKKITEDADAKIQKDNADLNNRLTAALRMPSRCVPVTASTPGNANAEGQPGQAKANAGLNSDWLIDYAGECERDRLQLNGLIDFVNAVWSRKQTDK